MTSDELIDRVASFGDPVLLLEVHHLVSRVHYLEQRLVAMERSWWYDQRRLEECIRNVNAGAEKRS